MSDQLHQINITYVDKEDRLLMRTTTRGGDEYRIWLTRRYTGLLLDVLNKGMHQLGDTCATTSVITSQADGVPVKQQETSYKPFVERAQNYPLGEKGILGFGIKSDITQDKILSLQLLPEEGQGITLNLNEGLLHSFQYLLFQGLTKTDWKIEQKTRIDNTASSIH